jgi:anti-sigma B factor antagonist
MKIQQQDQVLRVSEFAELGAANSQTFRDEVRAALAPHLKTVEIDLSQTRFVDSCGLGALIAVQKSAGALNGGATVRLVNLQPPVQQLFELTRLHHLFEIVRR